jgi:hypothetical protein
MMLRACVVGLVLAVVSACSGASVPSCPTPQVAVSQLTVPVDRRWAGSSTVVSATGDASAVRWTFKVSGLPAGVVASGAGAEVGGFGTGALSFKPSVDDALGASLDAVPGTYTVSVSTAPSDANPSGCDPAGVASVSVTLVVEDRAAECVSTADCQTLDSAHVDQTTQATLHCTASTECPQNGTTGWCVAHGGGAAVCVDQAVGCTAPLVEVTRTAVEGNMFLSCNDATPTSTCNARGHCVCAAGVISSGSCR